MKRRHFWTARVAIWLMGVIGGPRWKLRGYNALLGNPDPTVEDLTGEEESK